MCAGSSDAFPLDARAPVAIVHRNIDARLAVYDEISSSQGGLPDYYDVGPVDLFLGDVRAVEVVVVMGFDIEGGAQNIQKSADFVLR